MKTITSICIVEDSTAFSNWLEADLSVFDELKVTGKLSTVESAKNHIQMDAPDIIILDLKLNKGSGFELLDHLKDLAVRPIVYVLTSHNLASIKNRCLELGADGFYDKSSDYFKLIETVRSYKKVV